MSDDLSSGAPGTPVVVRFLTHLFDLPGWQKVIVVIAGILGVAGVGGKIGEKSADAQRANPNGVVQSNGPDSTAGRDGKSRGFLPQSTGSSHSTGTAGDDVAGPNTDENSSALQSFLTSHGPWMRHVGLTFLAAFVIGWLFRAFVRMMTMFATLAMLIFLGLSYFGVTNVDLTAVHKKYDDSIAWVNDQAARAKDALIAHVPAGASSFFGFAFGFKRKKI